MINIFRTEKQKDKGEKKKCAVFFSLVSLSVLCINMEKQRIQYRYEQQRYQCAECQPNMASGSNGIMPRIVVSAAIDTGRKRLCELSIKAFIGSTP